MARWLVALGLALSTSLLAVMTVDRLSFKGGSTVPASPGAEGIPGYHYALRPRGELLASLSEHDLSGGLHALNARVFESLVHGPSRDITFSQNWLAWGLGRAFSSLRGTQEPRRVIQGGQGLCHDAVAVLIQLAETQGLKGQMVDLNGHVVALFEEGGQRWIADPDFGFLFRGTLERLSEPQGLQEVRAAVSEAGHGLPHQDAYAAAIAAVKGHRVIPGARLSPRLSWIERALNVLAWLIPEVLLLVLARKAWLRQLRYGTATENLSGLAEERE